MPGLILRLWPRSLKGQVLLALALALLLVQTLGAALQYQVQVERRRDAQAHMLAFRFFNAARRSGDVPPGRHHRGPPPPRAAMSGPPDLGPPPDADDHGNPRADHGPPPGEGASSAFRAFRPTLAPSFPALPGDRRVAHTEAELREIFAGQDMALADVRVVERATADDAVTRAALAARTGFLSQQRFPIPERVTVAGVRLKPGGDWLVARMLAMPGQQHVLMVLILQTLILYAVLVGTMALVLRRITQPLAALTSRVEQFARTRAPQGALELQGPDDLRRLIAAHNAMEQRIIALIDEKDVMLGAIGHDLKTPLAALRVRIETVEDEHERARMADTIDDIARSLDDMLSLARVGRPSDPMEPTALAALVESVVEEYEDMGEPVELAGTVRLMLPLRTTWLRRALRNLIGNALRYGQRARVSLAREAGPEGDWAVVRIDDDGPGVAESDLARMLEPFTRGEPSRNSVTGGAGLGLTLARAIAEQHGGTLELANRHDERGAIVGLSACLRLPMA